MLDTRDSRGRMGVLRRVRAVAALGLVAAGVGYSALHGWWGADTVAFFLLFGLAVVINRG